MKYCNLLILVFIIGNSVQAQEKSVSKLAETGLWNGLYLKGLFSDKIGYYAEHHLRYRNDVDKLTSFVGRKRQLYNRAGINFLVNKNFEIVVGPTLVLNYTPYPGNPDFEKVTYEPRIWHQWLLIMPPLGRVKFYHQFRFEHRWKRSNEVGAEHEYTNRFRYKVFAYVPLNKKEIGVKTLFFSPSAEIFMHEGKSVVYNPFEDFRTYNGLGYIVNRNLTFFAGHMWTIGQGNTGFEYNKTHIIRLNVFVGFDMRRAKDKVPKINIGY